MLKQFLSTAAVLALMAGPAYAQADQAGKGKADGSNMSSTMEKSDSGSGASASGTSGSTPTQSGVGASTAGAEKTTGDASASSASAGTTTGHDSGTAAATSTTAAASGDAFVTDQADGQWRAEKLIGANVKNAQDEDIGKIDDLVFSDDGRIEAAVVSVGGFLGIGAKNVALSWDQLQVRSSDAGEEIMVSLTKEQLENAPSFKTLEDKKSEEAAANARMQQGTTPAPTGMGTTN